MKKLLTAFVLISTIFVVSCGKKKSNVATTPNDCYNQNLSPAYYPNNSWNQGNQQYGNQWGNQQYGNQWGNQQYGNQYNQYGNQNHMWNPNNVGCLGQNPYSPYNGNGYQQIYNQGVPYYYVPQQPCALNTSVQTCPVGHVCMRQQNMYVWSWGFDGFNRQGVCTRFQ